jgi:hypothetical protein
MLAMSDFSVREMSPRSVMIIHTSTGQTFKFETARGLGPVGDPSVSEALTKHPPWLMAWFARRLAHETAKSDSGLYTTVPRERI